MFNIPRKYYTVELILNAAYHKTNSPKNKIEGYGIYT